jgi:lipid-A-disaccharide synthase
MDQERRFDLLNAADAVITTCGTSNLEAALLGAPFVAVYKVNRLTYLLGRRFLKIGRYSIVNILAGQPLATELIQNECRAERIYEEAAKLLSDAAHREKMRGEFRRLRDNLQQEERPAAIIRRQMLDEMAAAANLN